MAARRTATSGSNIIRRSIEPSILTIRGHKVLLDQDLARMYGVSVKRLNQAVSRNPQRFPVDFMFRLTATEFNNLKSQFAISSWGGRRYAPYAFTEHGAVMLAAVLNSPIAIQASIQIVRAFVRLRQILASHEQLRSKLDAIERKLEDHDQNFAAVFEAIRQLMDADAEEASKPRIGFETEGSRKRN